MTAPNPDSEPPKTSAELLQTSAVLPKTSTAQPESSPVQPQTSPAQPQSASLWPTSTSRPVTEPGTVPAAYRPEHHSLPQNPASGVGTDRRDEKAESGHTRDLRFPEAPEPLPVPIVDNHTHMDTQDGRIHIGITDILDTAQDLGVRGVLQVGCDVESSRWAVQAAQQDSRVLAAVALHPNETPALAEAGRLDEAMAEIAELATHERVRAIGETGLDYFRTRKSRRHHQHRAFREHIHLAKSLGLAMQIHDRDAHQDIVQILREEGAPERTVFHCFSGDAELARICNENGWYMSFSGTVTFKNSTDLQEALTVARPELILVETDAPFLTPHPYRGRPNAPYMVVQTARWMAQHKGMDLAEFCSRVDTTVREVYGEH
ncbi:TatD family hydrolase [Kocuria sp.]|uniref:TatD family hydrolase n=1 Tax=Kocuria sp. TaxID=1871328 RepID=UPI0026E01629|nr:TatD family hydrolase [Kocuria sp.]MDO5619048.1 YchF/TatD family DNA exonuclease [Kocuria sp.]